MNFVVFSENWFGSDEQISLFVGFDGVYFIRYFQYGCWSSSECVQCVVGIKVIFDGLL